MTNSYTGPSKSVFDLMAVVEHTRCMVSQLSDAITIRLAYAEDYPALTRLAALDSAERVPGRPLLMAEEGGEPRAALSLADGTSIADPFHRTAEILSLLELRASAAAAPRRRRTRRRLAGLSLAHG
jgi:hypothetical protein